MTLLHAPNPRIATETKGTFLSTAPAGRKAWRLAAAIVILSAAFFAAALPLSRVDLIRAPAFIPAYQSALATIDFITVVLLLGQFTRLRSRALLALAAGYWFNALITIAHAVSFPGAFSPAGLLGAGDQTALWLYSFWHAGFPLFVLAYATLSLRRPAALVPESHVNAAKFICIGGTALLVGGLTVLATAGMRFLPVVIEHGNYALLVSKGVSPAILLLCLAALAGLWRQKRTSVLNLWLMVVMCVWLCDVALSAAFSSERYDLGWYAGRSYGLLAASFLLAVLLIESNRLQNKLMALMARLAEAYRKDRARFMEIIDQAPIKVAIRDLQGRVQMANINNERWLEQTTASWRGKTVREIFGDCEFSRLHEKLDLAVKTTKKSVQSELIEPDKHDPHTLLCVKFPLFDSDDELEAVGSVAIDITDRKKLDAAVDRLFETSVDLILLVSPKGGILKVSPSVATILGYDPAEFAGHNAIDFIHPDDLESTRNEMRMARRGRATRNFETRYVHKDGRVVMLSWTGVWSDESQQHFFIGRDMTERMKLEQELRQSQKMEAIGQLTGGIAHDYNNLLTVILGNAELLAEALRDNPELHSLAQLTLDAADRSAVLTQRLLAFGRRQTLESQPTDVNELLTDMTDLMMVTVGEQVKIDLRLGADLWTPKFDRGQFETAILNLAVNARDAMPAGGKLTIETANVILDEDYVALNPGAIAGDYVGVNVSDTGMGMQSDVLSRVFEPFFTTKEVGKGTGLGLSMIYGFIKQSGGHVTIYSEPGTGTVVRLYFPRTDAPSIVPSLRQTPDEMLPGGNETILLVEDDPLVRAHTEKQLIALGYRVHTANQGQAALDLIEKELRPDLLFTDVVMPDGMNGQQLADEVHKRLPDLKVLFTSGYTQGTVIRDDNWGHSVNFLGKPFRRAELAAKLRELLDGKTFVEA